MVSVVYMVAHYATDPIFPRPHDYPTSNPVGCNIKGLWLKVFGECMAASTVDKMDTTSNTLEVLLTCPECGAQVITDPHRGEVICTNCGLVCEAGLPVVGFDSIRSSHELASQVQHPYGTYISKGWQALDGEIHDHWKRLRRTHIWTQIPRDRGRQIYKIVKRIRQLAIPLRIPEQVRMVAEDLCIRAEKAQTSQTRHAIRAVVYLYLACRLHDLPRSLKEFTRVLQEQGQTPRKKQLRVTFQFQEQVCKTLGIRLTPQRPHEFILREARSHNLPRPVVEKALEICDRVWDGSSQRPVGGSRTSIAAAAVYLAGKYCGVPLTQKQCAKIFGVCELTVRCRQKELRACLQSVENAGAGNPSGIHSI
ncbi:MAG: hypothetical protein DRO73_10940 [Candidatus Thorarchaeota archaeon]|nr:MAG: hypothetical protein DRO73_10940 [Candidatus Thorarchaeota archaeon]